MTQKKLSKWLCVIVIGLGIAGLYCLTVMAPRLGHRLVLQYPRWAHMYTPTLIFTWVCAVPFYLGLYAAYLISVDIGRDRSFIAENSHRLKRIGIYAVIESVLIFVILATMLTYDILHPVVAMILVLLALAVISISVICFALSHLVLKAAKLQEENDLTI